VQRGGGPRGFPGHSVRTERYRYTEWAGDAKGSELYDHQMDLEERKNVAGDPKNAEVVREMKALLKKIHPEPVQGGKADRAFIKALGVGLEF
jgi:hypothetical protein